MANVKVFADKQMVKRPDKRTGYAPTRSINVGA